LSATWSSIAPLAGTASYLRVAITVTNVMWMTTAFMGLDVKSINAWVRLVTMRIILMVIVYGNMDWAIDVKIASVY
jgi:hypothetical protein